MASQALLPSLGADQTDRLLTGEGDKSLKDDFKKHVSYLESQEFKIPFGQPMCHQI